MARDPAPEQQFCEVYDSGLPAYVCSPRVPLGGECRDDYSSLNTFECGAAAYCVAKHSPDPPVCVPRPLPGEA